MIELTEMGPLLELRVGRETRRNKLVNQFIYYIDYMMIDKPMYIFITYSYS